MIIGRLTKDHGICFAWLPKWTPDGKVWLEFVHWERIPSWGWGSGDTFRDARFVPHELYDQGVCREWGGKAYATPPEPQKLCKNFRTDGPTPCHYPNCHYTDHEGVARCGVDHIAFGEN